MHRFFCPNQDLSSPVVDLTDPGELHHLKNVLRLKSGSPVRLFDGKGKEATGKILMARQNLVRVEIDNVLTEQQGGGPLVILACAIPKKSKFETIIEKCTELGVSEIIPLITERTEAALTESQKLKKLARYRTVALNAAKQSQRKVIPVINPVTPFKEFLKKLSRNEATFIPCLTGNNKSLADVFKKLTAPPEVTFLIGPEGDFTQKEVHAAKEAGCRPVSLGSTVLKVDTAAITVVAATHLFFHR